MPRLPEPRFAADCAIVVDGSRVPARGGESVAAALLAAGRPLLGRSPKYHRPRGPFCLAGSCGQCLVRVEGQPNVRACRTACRDGLRVETQNAWPQASHDLLGAVDWLAPRGLDHHHLAIRPAVLNRVAVRVSRALSGTGRLPDAAPPPWPPAREERFEAVVVGGGPAGLGAAEALAAAGRRVLLAEQDRWLGGRLRARLFLPGDPPAPWAEEVAAAVRRAGGEVVLGAAALGLWRDGGEPLLAILSEDPRWLRLVRAPRMVLCPGGAAQPPLFDGNDRPGIFAGRGLAVALAEHGVVPGQRAVVLGDGPEPDALAARLRQAGMETAVTGAAPARARGRRRVTALDLANGLRLECDTVAVCGPPAPACDLAREAGAAVAFDAALGAFAVRAGPDGATGVPGLWAAGETTGALGAGEAAAAGRRAGEAARG
ncbi:MAG TPA: 2Fe-2S iron-sulfur cluster-binding protein [Anaeromyxobacteraceae bacterium]|nr:2Fe-2S iron-sulfur cluster-binding protein [Anaeromyxobacteraceae bacterium]